MEEKIERLACNLKLLALDVDGVMTDGRIIYDDRGSELKCFDVKDGLGLKQLKKSGIDVAIISGRDCPALRCRIEELGIEHYYLGCENKAPAFLDLLEKLKLTANLTGYVGDDLPDLPILELAGFKATVADGHESVKSVAHFISKRPGGRGAVREICDFILNSLKHKESRPITKE